MLRRYLPYYRNILRLALPLLLGQVGNIAVNFADNIMVGHYSTEALASASFVNNVFNIALFACMGFSYGLTPLVGALFAKGDHVGIRRLVGRGMWVNVVFNLIIMAVMTVLFFNLEHLGQPAELMPLIKPYYLIVLAGMVPMCIFGVIAQWCFGIGNTKLPTYIILTANALNIIGNYILIFGHFGAPELGLTGAGISTFIARILTAAAAVVVYRTYFRRHTAAGTATSGVSTGTTVSVRALVTTSFPVAGQMAFETASFSGSAVMAGWLGAIPLAAYQIVVVSGMFGFCLYYSIGAALAIPVSHAAGRGDTAAMRRSAWAGYHLTLLTMLGAIALFLFAGEHIMGIFSNDPAVITLAVTLLVPMCFYQFGDATQITFANALRGTSHSMPMLWIAFVSYIIVGIPVTYLFAFPMGMGLYGIVLSFTVCLLVAGAQFLYFFLRTTKKMAQKDGYLSENS